MANGLMHIQQPPQGFSEFKRIFCKTPISYPNDPGTQHSGYLMHVASLSLPSTGKLNDCNTQKDIHINTLCPKPNHPSISSSNSPSWRRKPPNRFRVPRPPSRRRLRRRLLQFRRNTPRSSSNSTEYSQGLVSLPLFPRLRPRKPSPEESGPVARSPRSPTRKSRPSSPRSSPGVKKSPQL